MGSMNVKTVEIFAIGNELLLGDVQDTNTHWLCQQLVGLGAQVCRGVLLPDDVEVIASELRQSAMRQRTLLITTGGLGPTEDDQTLKAVALAFDRTLQLDDEAYRMVQQRYEELAAQGFVESAEMTEPRKKMAIIPTGSVPLFNPVGTAPGVWLEWERGHVVLSLPGVPRELKGIWETSLPPYLQTLLGRAYFKLVEVIADCCDESRLAPIVSAIAHAHPRVYVKSRATRFGTDVRLKITLSLSANDRNELDAELHSAVSDLERQLKEADIGVEVRWS